MAKIFPHLPPKKDARALRVIDADCGHPHQPTRTWGISQQRAADEPTNTMEHTGWCPQDS